MAKRLTFTPGDGDQFDQIFVGFHLAGRPGSREDHRITAKILDALDEISIEYQPSKPVPGFPAEDEGAPRHRMLKPEGGFIVLEDHQFAFMTRALSNMQTLPVRSRAIEAMWMFIDSAEDGSMKKLLEPRGMKPEADD